MLFNSFEFLIFLPVVFCLYWFVFKGLKVQNLFVVAASYFFYGMWDWRFLLLIFLTTLSSWGSGLCVDRHRASRRLMRLAVGANIVVNIGILAYFKYFNFFVENLQLLFSQFGYQLDWATLEILLPVGISFYTFQAVSYTIDVYRGQIAATRDFVAFMAFVSFFPQLVAGPIERSTQLLPQFLRPRRFEYGIAVSGMQRILWGFFKKIVVADNCAYLANQIFGDPGASNGSMLLLGLVFFTFQLYGDFSGYSDIAVGTGRLFGIKLMDNFRSPYLLSTSVQDYWKRNHISLTTWFMDYVYYPLTERRNTLNWWCFCIFLTFVLSGLWHGTAWTFVVWGALQGVLLVIEMRLGKRRKKFEKKHRLGKKQWYLWLQRVVAITTVCLTLVFFRADTLGDAFRYFRGMFSSSLLQLPSSSLSLGSIPMAVSLLFILVLQVAEYRRRDADSPMQTGLRSRAGRWAVYLAVVMSIVVFAGAQEKFIYFQF